MRREAAALATSSGPAADPAPRYGFYGRLRPEFPSQVVIDVTEFCNLACVHCPHPSFKKSEHFSGRSLDPELNARAVDEVGARGAGITQYLRYTGNGEPLIHPRLFEMLAYATGRSGTFVSLTTNGTLLDPPRVERLLATGVDLVDVSLDALSAETYARVRVHGDLTVVGPNVERLIAASRQAGSRTRVVVSYVEQPANRHETDGFEAYWQDRGADRVVVRRLHSSAGAVIPIADVMRREQQAAPRRPCLYPWERITLDPRGMLAFCPTDWSHGSTVADFRETTIYDAWHGKFYRLLREAHLSNRFDGHGFCGQCPDWQQTRWPDQGRSYADLVEELAVERGRP